MKRLTTRPSRFPLFVSALARLVDIRSLVLSPLDSHFHIYVGPFYWPAHLFPPGFLKAVACVRVTFLSFFDGRFLLLLNFLVSPILLVSWEIATQLLESFLIFLLAAQSEIVEKAFPPFLTLLPWPPPRGFFTLTTECLPMERNHSLGSCLFLPSFYL